MNKAGLPKSLDISPEARAKYNLERTKERYPNAIRCVKCGYVTQALGCRDAKGIKAFKNIRYCKRCDVVFLHDTGQIIE